MAPGVGTNPPTGGGVVPDSGEVRRCAGSSVGIATNPGVGGDTLVDVVGEDSREPVATEKMSHLFTIMKFGGLDESQGVGDDGGDMDTILYYFQLAHF